MERRPLNGVCFFLWMENKIKDWLQVIIYFSRIDEDRVVVLSHSLFICVIYSWTVTNVSSNTDGWNGDTGKSIGLCYGSNNRTSSAAPRYVPEHSLHSHECNEIFAKLFQERPGIVHERKSSPCFTSRNDKTVFVIFILHMIIDCLIIILFVVFVKNADLWSGPLPVKLLKIIWSYLWCIISYSDWRTHQGHS